MDPENRPGLSVRAAEWLATESGLSMIAIDSIGVESRRTRDCEVNVILCRGGVLILEGLVNLHRLGPGLLHLEAFPLKLRGWRARHAERWSRISPPARHHRPGWDEIHRELLSKPEILQVVARFKSRPRLLTDGPRSLTRCEPA